MRRAGQPAMTPGIVLGVEFFRSYDLTAVCPVGPAPEAPLRLHGKRLKAKDATKYKVRLMEMDRTVLQQFRIMSGQ